ncbi:MAG: SRPBCC family protein [Acidimicrobiales bacterium]|nr:SRPBCC family protein [Acidimicrobiales bacterium]
MRMADKPTVSVETVIDAPADVVYEVVSNLEVMGSMGTEFQRGEWATGRPGTLGSTFVGYNRRNENEWSTTSRVVAAEPGRAFGWDVLVGDTDEALASWHFTMRQVPDGTEVVYTATMGPGPSGLTAVIDKRPDDEEEIIDARLKMHQENMVKTLEGIRRRVTQH